MNDLPPQVQAPVTDALLRFRAHAAEVALLTMIEQLDAMLAQAKAFATHLQDLNKRFPLGDETADGARKLQLDAIRAQVPGLAHMGDDQLLALMKKPDGPTPSSP